MSPRQTQLHLHQFEQANPPRPLDSESQSQHLFNHNAASFQAHGNSNLHPDPSERLMDSSQFNTFAFYQGGLPEQSSLMALGDQANLKFDDDHAQAFNHHASMASLSDGTHGIRPGSVHGASIGTAASDHSGCGVQDRNSPMANPVEDSATDDFGLSSTASRADGTDLGRAKDDRGDAPPAWSELKTKAGKERKRLPLACIACRRKKIRCSGEKPACKHCLRARTPCVYKVTTRKAAPRTDYMAMLDKRLKRMEERIIKVIPKTDQPDPAANVTRAVVKPAIPGTAPASKAGPKKRNAEEAFGPDLEAWAKAPARTMGADEKPTSLQIQETEDDKLFHEGIDALPSKEIQEHLAEVFFDNIYGQAYHLLHKPSYMRKLKSGTLPPVLVLSVCAIAARFTGNPNLNSPTPQFMRGEEWASTARDICTRRYEWPNITILTCLLILGLHEFGTCQGGRSWALGGQAIRMAFALQLHKDLDYDPLGRNGNTQLSFIDREIRRRTMWACFLMDRFNSSGTERPMFIKDEIIQIPLPVKEQCFQLDMPAPTEYLNGRPLPDDDSDSNGHSSNTQENMGVTAHMIRAIAIWGRIITYLNQGGKELDLHPMWNSESEFAKLVRDAENLAKSLPGCLQYTRENVEIHKTENTANQFLFLHMSIQQNLLFLHRAAMVASATAKKEHLPQDFSSTTSAKTFGAANQISDCLKAIEGSTRSVTAPFAGYCAFSSATVHIMAVFSDDAAIKTLAESNLGVNVKFLHQMKKYWGMFHWMVENVRTQFRNALDASRSGAVNSKSRPNSPILQYADWFNRYPHGLSDAEYMDPVLGKHKEKGGDGVLGAKPELHSVEEFLSTLSPQSVESREGRSNAMKRKPIPRKQSSAVSRHGSTASSEHMGGQQQQSQRRFSNATTNSVANTNANAIAVQTSGPTTFNGLSTTHTQNAGYHAISPISPVAMTQFPHHQHPHPFFPPELLAMNLNQHTSGIIQPLDRQLVFGGYGGMNGSQDMMDGVDWESMADERLLGRRNMKAGVNGQHAHDQTTADLNGMASFGGQDSSSAWFMPFNMEPPPDLTGDLGISLGNIDHLAAMFGGNGNTNGNSGMTTPNPLGGLRHGH